MSLRKRKCYELDGQLKPLFGFFTFKTQQVDFANLFDCPKLPILGVGAVRDDSHSARFIWIELALFEFFSYGRQRNRVFSTLHRASDGLC